MVSQHITTHLFQVQVRVDDQSTYPHHMSTGFVSRGVDMGASAPCCFMQKLSTADCSLLGVVYL